MPTAVNIRGIQPLAWGTETITGYVTNSSSRDVSTEEFVIKDEQGRIITQITGFGVKTEFTFEVIPKSAATIPVAGDIMTIGSEKCVILTLGRKRTDNDVEKWSIKGVSYPDIDLDD